MKNKVMIYGASAVLILVSFAVITYFYKESQRARLNFLASESSELFVREHSPRYGNPEAKVILTEFLDPECESCRAFYPIVKSLLQEFEGKVQLVIRYAPFHQNSKIAIKAIEAARFQGMYWEALETLFIHQPEWGDHHNPRPELIFQYLRDLGLNMERLQTDMEAQKIQGIILQDENDLRELKVSATHIDRSSPLVYRHHVNWRLKSIQRGEKLSSDELNFTMPCSLSEKAFHEIKETLLDTIERVGTIVDSGKEESLACLNIDWFRF